MIRYKLIAIREDESVHPDANVTPSEWCIARMALQKAGLLPMRPLTAEERSRFIRFWKIFTDLRDKERILKDTESRGWLLGWEERKRYDRELALYIPVILFGLAVSLLAVMRLI